MIAAAARCCWGEARASRIVRKTSRGDADEDAEDRLDDVGQGLAHRDGSPWGISSATSPASDSTIVSARTLTMVETRRPIGMSSLLIGATRGHRGGCRQDGRAAENRVRKSPAARPGTRRRRRGGRWPGRDVRAWRTAFVLSRRSIARGGRCPDGAMSRRRELSRSYMP